MVNDTITEEDEIFYLEIDNNLPSGVYIKQPSEIDVTIEDDECKYMCV